MTHRRGAIRTLLALVALLGFIAVGCSSSGTDIETSADTRSEVALNESAESAESSDEEAAPETASATGDSLVVSTIDGGQIDFASLEGQDVVLWFWAPW